MIVIYDLSFNFSIKTINKAYIIAINNEKTIYFSIFAITSFI